MQSNDFLLLLNNNFLLKVVFPVNLISCKFNLFLGAVYIFIGFPVLVRLKLTYQYTFS